MIITIVTTLMMMAAYFLLLYAGVAYIQDKKFFSSAPKEIVDAIPDRKERFKGAHTIGWGLIAVAFLAFAGAFVLGGWDGIKNDFSFLGFFIRFIIMLYGLEIFDIGFFDWKLLCHSNIFPRYYPEVTDIVGPHIFGFNWKIHLMHFIVYIPVGAVIAWICTIF